MAFDDLAKRVAASRGVKLDGSADAATLIKDGARLDERHKGTTWLVMGVLLMLLGLGITLLSYETAESYYFVPTGFVAMGLLFVIAGVSHRRANR